MSTQQVPFKVVLLGEGSVGKTSLILRYTAQKFNDQHIMTEQAAYQNKFLNIDNHRVQLSIWDTAGQEKFHALAPIYYRDANAALLVYDITSQDSFDRVQNWVKELHGFLGTDVVLAIAGNKIDLERKRVISIEQGEKYAQEVGAVHFNTSAKLDKGVNELFFHLAKKLLDTNQKKKGGLDPKPKKRIVWDEGPTAKGSGTGDKPSSGPCSCG